MLILAMDTNFRLSNHICTNDWDNPELGPGWAYFVRQYPYADFLKDYVNEVNVNGHMYNSRSICNFMQCQ
jgi:hypothetical protein